MIGGTFSKSRTSSLKFFHWIPQKMFFWRSWSKKFLPKTFCAKLISPVHFVCSLTSKFGIQTLDSTNIVADRNALFLPTSFHLAAFFRHLNASKTTRALKSETFTERFSLKSLHSWVWRSVCRDRLTFSLGRDRQSSKNPAAKNWRSQFVMVIFHRKIAKEQKASESEELPRNFPK